METHKIVIPDLGGVDVVTVLEILIAPGDKVHVDQALMTVESDKASMDVPSDKAGIVQTILVQVGEQVRAGLPCVEICVGLSGQEIIAESAEEALSATSVSSGQLRTSLVGSDQDKSRTVLNIEQGAAARLAVQSMVKGVKPGVSDLGVQGYAAPSARKLARELGIDIAVVPGTGRGGRVTLADVIATVRARMQHMPIKGVDATHTGAKKVSWQDPATFGTCETITLSKIKKATITAMMRARDQVVHVTQCDRVDITELEAYRNQHKDSLLSTRSIRLTMLAFIMKALAMALKRHPLANASYQPDTEKIWLKHYMHIGVAVDTPDGLVVPVVKDVDQKSVIEIAIALGELSAKARVGQLLPGDLVGASFTVSSLGGIGGAFFTPIVNIPQAAILGVSRATQQPVWDGSIFQPRLLLPLSLSYDHRLLDGAQAMRFLNDVMQTLQTLSQFSLDKADII